MVKVSFSPTHPTFCDGESLKRYAADSDYTRQQHEKAMILFEAAAFPVAAVADSEATALTCLLQPIMYHPFSFFRQLTGQIRSFFFFVFGGATASRRSGVANQLQDDSRRRDLSTHSTKSRYYPFGWVDSHLSNLAQSPSLSIRCAS